MHTPLASLGDFSKGTHWPVQGKHRRSCDAPGPETAGTVLFQHGRERRQMQQDASMSQLGALMDRCPVAQGHPAKESWVGRTTLNSCFRFVLTAEPTWKASGSVRYSCGVPMPPTHTGQKRRALKESKAKVLSPVTYAT